MAYSAHVDNRNAGSLICSSILICFAFTCLGRQTVDKKKVLRESDLPRFTYAINGSLADFLQSGADAFSPFADKIRADLQTVLDNYDIQDKSTKRTLLDAKLSFEEMDGENEEALHTIQNIRNLEEKPDARLMTDLLDEAFLQARLDSTSTSGPSYEEAFARRFAASLNQLSWNVVQEPVKQMKGTFEMLSAKFIAGATTSNLQPMVDKSGTVDNQTAWFLLFLRRGILFAVPLKGQVVRVLQSYIAAHSVEKPDIWPSREVTLTSIDKPDPVLVGIWDTGVDTSAFPTQLYTDPDPGWHDRHGMAFDDQGGHSSSLLLPLTNAQRQEYPSFAKMLKGFLDQNAGTDTPEATAFRQKMGNTPPDQVRPIFSKLRLYGAYAHGTHVAGIAIRGNPAARLVVFRFNDQLPKLTFAPTAEYAHRMADNFREIGEYCRTHHVRVVNMSWEDDPNEFEEWLSTSGEIVDPVARKTTALQLFAIWKTGISDAIKAAPGTLFVCAAGNSNSNADFIDAVPSSLRLPNLLTAGAVDQGGDETSFTSYGDTVVVHADGYNVESYIPGGISVKWSGTSMASPNVANLAAKLIALDASLTPEQVISMVREGASATADGRRHLIDEKRSVALLRDRVRR